MSLEIGQIVEGKYRIIRLIGEGGMGAVYEGENVRIKRRVAIKVLHAATATNAEAVQRFEREAQAAGRIGSDHILEVLDLGTLPNNDRFMVMEFLDGEALSTRIQSKGRIAPRELVPLAKQVLAGLAAAHSAGIIHRDLKPDNIYILKEKAGQLDYVKIIDFGISKFQALAGDQMHMTRTGTVMGTPYYMSPEQANGSREADARSDLYSIGVILYEAITGQVPFDAKSFNELLFKIVLSTPPSPLTIVPDLDPSFCSIVSKGMARELDHRFQTAAQFVEALDNWARSGQGVTVPPEHRQAHQDAAGIAVPKAAALPDLAAAATEQPPPTVTATSEGLRLTSGGGSPGKQSSQSWATSQHDAVPGLPKSGKSSGAIIAAIVGLIVIGGGFGAYKVLGGSAASKTETTVIAAPQVPPKVAEPVKTAELVPPPPPETTAEAKPVEAKPVEPTPSAAKPAAVPVPVVRAGTRPPPPRPQTPPTRPPTKAPGTPDFGY